MQEKSLRGALDVRQAPRPAWTSSYLTRAQQKDCSPALLWINLIRDSVSLGRDAKALAMELYITLHTRPEGRVLEWSPGIPELRRNTGIGKNQLTAAHRELSGQGWLYVIEGRPNTYRLTWPESDRMDADHAICGEWAESAGNKGKVCEQRAGFGTTTPGKGPCKYHGGERKSPQRGLTESAKSPGRGLDSEVKSPQRGLSEDREEELSPLVATRKSPGGYSASPLVATRKSPTRGTKEQEKEQLKEQEKNPGVPDAVAEVEVPSAPARSDEPNFSLDDVVMADAWRAAARRKLPEDAFPEHIEAYATALAYAETTQGVFVAPAWPLPERSSA